MTMITNPSTASWVNATQGTDQNGNTVPWDALTDMAGVQVSFDGQPAVSVPTQFANKIALSTVGSYAALPPGQHTMTVADVTKEGAVSPPSQTVTFLVAVVPNAPTGLALA